MLLSRDDERRRPFVSGTFNDLRRDLLGRRKQVERRVEPDLANDLPEALVASPMSP
jgi:hypothetical protein